MLPCPESPPVLPWQAQVPTIDVATQGSGPSLALRDLASYLEAQQAQQAQQAGGGGAHGAARRGRLLNVVSLSLAGTALEVRPPCRHWLALAGPAPCLARPPLLRGPALPRRVCITHAAGCLTGCAPCLPAARRTPSRRRQQLRRWILWVRCGPKMRLWSLPAPRPCCMRCWVSALCCAAVGVLRCACARAAPRCMQC